MDLALLRLLRTRGHTPALDSAARLAARAGENGAVWLAAAALTRNRRAFAVILAALIANTAVKQVVRRPRPDLGPELPPLASTISSLSYPSAHAATSFAAAGALGPSWPLYAAAGAMAVTRPYLGVHYPSDVLAGAALGWAVEKLA
ncbi:MAG TPA: phosphatase PAP2 family protein [Thermoleophilaceae bacterium]|nr:phosphatase PAP2 family protein [Thermoleophilaceae bacterium]